MPELRYAYSAHAPRNPLRTLLALWRALRDPANTNEVARVQLALLRSRTLRRFVRPDELVSALRRDPRTAARLRALAPFPPIDLRALARLPQGSFGRAVSDQLEPRGLDPNLVDFPAGGEEERVLQHLYASHDLWHVATGWGNDLAGEAGIGGFYAAQLGSPAFFAVLHALLLLNAVFFQPSALPERNDAFAAGWEAGRRAEPLFGVDWPSLYALPLAEARAQLGLGGARIVGEGVAA